MKPLSIALVALLALASPAAAQQDDEDVKITVEQVSGDVYVLMGRGGNIGLCRGPDGAFVVDDQFAPLTEKIVAAIATVCDAKVRFVVNTHWHGDHTGGNESFGKAGAVIVAHDNVRRRMSTEQFMKAFDRRVPASPPAALPIVTFAEGVTFHLNGETTEVVHVRSAHTDGDALVHFRSANVLHMGDTFFHGSYPFVDLGSGGSIDGVIAAVDTALKRCDGKTRIIPGHGPVAGREQLEAYGAMLKDMRTRVHALKAKGLSLEAVLAEKPSAAYDEKLGGGFISPERFVTMLYASIPIE